MISKYIDWDLYPKTIKTATEILNLVDNLRRAGYVEIKSNDRATWVNQTKAFKLAGLVIKPVLIVKTNLNYTVYATAQVKRKEINKEIPPYPNQCFKMVRDTFQEHTGCDFDSTFGRVLETEFHYCVPKPFYYINRNFACMEVDHAQYIDVSSMYPSCARGTLPTTVGMKRVNGRVLPTEEYPFCFYLKSHHCAEYKVFDTHDYLNLPRQFTLWMCFTNKGIPIYENIPDEKEITVMMKAATAQLDSTFEYWYQKKLEGDVTAKAIMNVTIGMFHTSRMKEGYFHLAAIILGRANKKQFDMVNKIQKNGGILLQSIVDSLIYIGNKNYGKNKKIFGEYVNEFPYYPSGVKYRSSDAINRYVIYDGRRKILKYVVAGVPADEQVVNVPEDIDKYNRKEGA